MKLELETLTPELFQIVADSCDVYFVQGIVSRGKDTCGLSWLYKNKIYLVYGDYCCEPLDMILMHELLHQIYPILPECFIMQQTKILYKDKEYKKIAREKLLEELGRYEDLEYRLVTFQYGENKSKDLNSSK